LTYSLKHNIIYIVAVSVDQFVTRIAVMDTQNKCVTGIEKFELPLAKNSQALSILTEKIAGVIKHARIPKSKIAGIGIGMPGFVDVTKGVNYTFFQTSGKSITETIADKTGLPVYIDNDSSLIALAELRFGEAGGTKDVMVINIGWGVGLGMLLGGKLFRGHNGFAGEFSHIPMFSNGKLCSCGKRGCLETESSMLVVIEKARNGVMTGRETTLKNLPKHNLEQASEMIINAAQEGDRFAIELLSEAGYNIGRGLAILIHLLNPREIILSGRGSLAGKIWQAPIQQAINEHCIPRLASNVIIETSSIGYQADLMGAAALVMDNYDKATSVKSKSGKSKAIV